MVYGRYTREAGWTDHDWVLTRLHADGSHDPSVNFVMDAFQGGGIGAIVTRTNGDLVVGGAFATIGGTLRLSLARITANHFQANAVRERLAVPLGGTGFLEVRVTGAALPAFRWMKNDQPVVADGDRAVLALRDFSAADVGVYHAEVSSADGALTRTESIDLVLSDATISSALTPLSFSETGGLGAVRVDAPAGAAWSLQGAPSWIGINAVPVAAGSRTVTFNLAPNHTGAARGASLTIAGRNFAIQQAAASGRLINISTRGRAGAGGDVLIVGFVTTGAQPIDILSRGVGPTLHQFNLGGLLPDPALELFHGPTPIADNDDWDAGNDRDEILSESRRVSAFDLQANEGDSALLARLPSGAYTAILRDTGGQAGIALAEFYDRTVAAAFNPYNRVINISTRGRVGTGDSVLIAGFVITGTVPKQVLIRGVGPGLAVHGILDYLGDPSIRVLRGNEIVAHNDDWAFSEQAEAVAAAFGRTLAFPLDLTERDAALVVALEPGSYTVIMSGADGGEGVGLVEVYDLE